LATLFVGEESGLAVGGQFTREGKTWLVLVNETELLNEAPPEGEFAFSAPAGAKERSAAPAADGWAPVSKIFQGNCMPCHGANMAGGLDLRTYAAAAKSRSIVPGNPGASSMVAYVRGTRAPRMPIGRAPLSEADTKAIEAWIAGGAKE
jgi:mono/diheme cytochrome c family protein